MSIKIYTAYKLRKSSDLWPLVADIRAKGIKNVQKMLLQLYPGIIDGTLPLPEEIEKIRQGWIAPTTPLSTKCQRASRVLNLLYKNQLTDPYSNEYNFDVSVGIREHDGSIYIIPYADMIMGNTLDFLKRDRRLVDFHYQNQSDQPKNISYREWHKRKKVWMAMIPDEKWRNVLILEVCSYNTFYLIDPWLDYFKKLERASKRAA